ncbi:MAG: 6-bladed beta-propeller [Bacteroidota bacterium]
MNKVIWHTIILLLPAHFIACSDSTPDSTLKYIDVEKNIHNFEPFALSTIARDLEYIVLDSSEPALIGALKYIDINDHYIIAADGIKVILFDSKGKYIRKIGNEGRGPGEYLYLCQPKIMDSLIYLPDASNSSLLVYNLNGQFERKIKAPGKFSHGLRVNNWWPINNSTFLIHHPNTLGDERIKISSINQHGNILQEFMNSSFFPTGNTYFATSDMYANFISFKDKVYFKELLNDTIWLIGETNLEPAYILGMGKYGFKMADRALPLADFQNKLSETISSVNFFESPKYLFLVLYFMKHYPFPFKKIMYIGNEEREGHYAIIGAYCKDKDYFSFVAPSREKDQVERTGIENDIDGGINFLPKYSNNGKELIGWFDAYELKMYVASDAFKNSTPKYPEKKRELERLAKSLSENDNPVLMIVKLKE